MLSGLLVGCDGEPRTEELIRLVVDWRRAVEDVCVAAAEAERLPVD